jgi:hypothetical protein
LKREGSRWRRFLPAVIAITLILVAVAGAKIMTDPIKPWMSQENWTDLSPRNATITVRGVAKEIKLEYISYGLVSYHVFPAVIIFNVTEVVWMSDEVRTFINYDINNTFYNSFWNPGNLRSIGYDNKDMPSLSEGSLLEASGYWIPDTDSAYSMKLVVAPNVIGSYVKSLA